MDSQAQSQYPSDGPTASRHNHTGTGHNPFQYNNNHNHNHLPLTFSASPSAGYASSPTSVFSSGVHQQQQQPGQWGHTTHRSGATARDEVLQPPHHPPQQQSTSKSLKRDSMSQPNNNTKAESSSSTNGHGHHASEDPMPSTSDFVKKLYKMLEDPTFQEVVSWGPAGDCFVVKDMNEFTKSILPRMFKHSNFASFVRQLNKYDFHKVKNTDDNQFGEHSWTFRHPDFHADRRDALENIKRKVPAQRKSTSSSHPPPPPTITSSSSHPPPSSSSLVSSPTSSHHPPSASVDFLQAEIRRLKTDGEELRTRLRSLERNYENVLVEMVGFQRGMAQQDGLMQSLIAYFLGSESGVSLP